MSHEFHKVFLVVVVTAIVSSYVTFNLVDRQGYSSTGVASVDAANHERSLLAAKECGQVQRQNTESTEAPSLPPDKLSSAGDFMVGDVKPDGDGRGVSLSELREQIKLQSENIAKVRKTISSVGVDKIASYVGRRYQQEHIDYAWAMPQQDRLTELFSSDKALFEFYPDDVSCRSDNCEIVIPLADGSRTGEIYRSVLKSLMEGDDRFRRSTLTYVKDSAQSRLIMYLSRGENSSLFTGSD